MLPDAIQGRQRMLSDLRNSQDAFFKEFVISKEQRRTTKDVRFEKRQKLSWVRIKWQNIYRQIQSDPWKNEYSITQIFLALVIRSRKIFGCVLWNNVDLVFPEIVAWFWFWREIFCDFSPLPRFDEISLVCQHVRAKEYLEWFQWRSCLSIELKVEWSRSWSGLESSASWLVEFLQRFILVADFSVGRHQHYSKFFAWHRPFYPFIIYLLFLAKKLSLITFIFKHFFWV